MAEIKFCGLTRVEDARLAASLGAAYAGVVLAGGPRQLDVTRAGTVLAGVSGGSTRRAGVFGARPVDEIARAADALALDVIQLHSGATRDRILELQQRFGGEVWAVVGVGPGGAVPVGELADAAAHAAGVVLDTSVGGRSGGTGVAFDWQAAVQALAAVRGRARLIVAGGLRASNVAEAIAVLSPDVVDVSSGVESSPGIKDPGLMRAFAGAARPREE